MTALMCDSTGSELLIILKHNDEVYKECFTGKTGHSPLIMSLVDSVLKRAGIKVDDVDVFAACVGPGSFTGIRIGAVTVKTLCYALGKRAKAVVCNRMLAGNRGGKVLSVVYGWADMYYVAEYEDGKQLFAPAAMKKSEVDALILEKADSLLVTDERSHAAFGGELANERECMRLAAETGEYIDGDKLEPLYAMLSQAERELKK